MKAEELMIGNWITYKSTGDVEQVDEIISKIKHPAINKVNIADIEPIPLTEEWLEKFGFKKFKNYNDWSKNGIIVHGRKRGFVLRKSVPDIKYVHQLQNLYYALTGEQLTVKQ